MKNISLEQRLAFALVALEGLQELPRTSRYRKFARDNESKLFYFVGKQGALRRGRNVVSSVSLTGSVRYKELLALTTDEQLARLPAAIAAALREEGDHD